MNELSNLEQQAKSVCDKAHHLLGSPMNQLDGVVDTDPQRIDLQLWLLIHALTKYRASCFLLGTP